jgi:hypothetical protein
MGKIERRGGGESQGVADPPKKNSSQNVTEQHLLQQTRLLTKKLKQCIPRLGGCNFLKKVFCFSHFCRTVYLFSRIYCFSI